MVAKVMTGIESRNANLMDNFLDSPIKSAAVIVMPAREVPGINAKA
jgi:hypothetical protein